MRYVVFALALLVLSAGCISGGGGTVEATVVEPSGDSGGQAPVESGGEAAPVKTFVLTGVNYRFLLDGVEAPDLRVKVGERVMVEFTSTEGYHDFVVDEFNTATERVRPDDGKTMVEFVADKKGTFEYYCSVGAHRAQGMKGNLIVE
jgi:heme/copper-type cytochrome/quinol oxidase subunit 2